MPLRHELDEVFQCERRRTQLSGDELLVVLREGIDERGPADRVEVGREPKETLRVAQGQHALAVDVSVDDSEGLDLVELEMGERAVQGVHDQRETLGAGARVIGEPLPLPPELAVAVGERRDDIERTQRRAKGADRHAVVRAVLWEDLGDGPRRAVVAMERVVLFTPCVAGRDDHAIEGRALSLRGLDAITRSLLVRDDVHDVGSRRLPDRDTGRGDPAHEGLVLSVEVGAKREAPVDLRRADLRGVDVPRPQQAPVGAP